MFIGRIYCNIATTKNQLVTVCVAENALVDLVKRQQISIIDKALGDSSRVSQISTEIGIHANPAQYSSRQ